MMDDSLFSTLRTLISEKEQVSDKLRSNMTLQDDIHNKIDSLSALSDPAQTLFSPRNHDLSSQNQIRFLQSSLFNLQQEELLLRHQIEALSFTIEQQRRVLASGSKSLSSDTPVSSDFLDNYKMILLRLQTIYDFIDSDSSSAKHELDNLIYYLKALISSNSVS